MLEPTTRAEAYEAGILEEPADYKPRVAPWVRTTAYALCLATSFLSAVAIGLTAIWWPEIAPQVTATAGVAVSSVGILAGGVGVAYRPTR